MMSPFCRVLGFLVIAGCVVGPVYAADNAFTLTSPDIAPGDTIGPDFVFNGFGCTGKNISPALHWSGAPAGTQSLALTVYDPDAPTGSGWWHWVVYNIPAGTTEIPRDLATWLTQASVPVGAWQMGRTDYGVAAYGGPCPPVGDKPHRYIFTLYALNVAQIEVPAEASAAMIGFNLHAHKIATASFTATYGR